MTVEIHRARESEAMYVACHLRDDDRREAEALGMDPVEAVMKSFRYSIETRCIACDDVPFAVYGVGGGLLAGSVQVWAMGTDDCFRHPLTMVRRGREEARDLFLKYGNLENYCDARYKASLRWLGLLGFKVGEPEPYGRKGNLFCRLEMKKCAY